MKNIKNICIGILGILIILGGGLSVLAGSDTQDKLPFITRGTSNGIKYATGGVGIQERACMQKMANEYNLKLSFAMVSGAYLSDLMVTIQNSSGEALIETRSNGPWFFAKLPEGTYKVSAVCNGEKKTKQVEIRKGLQTVMFHWPS